MNAKAIERVSPVVGSVVLFLSWAVQTLLFSDWNASLSRLASTEATFQTYRASDGVFRGLQTLATPQQLVVLETQQEKNFDRGRALLRTLLDTATYREKRDQVLGSLPDGATPDQLNVNSRIEAEYTAVQLALISERTRLSNRMSRAETIFLGLYVAGTILVLAGGLAKLVPTRPSYSD